MTKGWKKESERHSLARKHIKTGREEFMESFEPEIEEDSVRIGSKIRLTNPDYGKKYYNKVYTVEYIAHNHDEHPGYDEGIGGLLIDCKEFGFSIYEFEFDVVKY
jgi:hypothetical protein